MLKSNLIQKLTEMNGCQLGAILPPKGDLAVSGDILVVRTREGAPGI